LHQETFQSSATIDIDGVIEQTHSLQCVVLFQAVAEEVCSKHFQLVVAQVNELQRCVVLECLGENLGLDYSDIIVAKVQHLDFARADRIVSQNRCPELRV